MNTPNTSRAFTVGKTESGWARKIVDMPIDKLGDGDVLIQVKYSGINFKDGLASTEKCFAVRQNKFIEFASFCFA